MSCNNNCNCNNHHQIYSYNPNNNTKSNKTDSYEHVNHPSHYNNYSKETIDMMIDIFGLENTITFCEMTAFKYRMRMGTKPDNDINQDLNKEQWYLNKAKQLKSLLNTNKGDSDNAKTINDIAKTLNDISFPTISKISKYA